MKLKMYILIFGIICLLSLSQPITSFAFDVNAKITERDAVAIQLLTEYELRDDAQLQFFMTVEQKNEMIALMHAEYAKIDVLHAKFKKQQQKVESVTKQIQQFKTKNKNATKGTKAQKDAYQKQYKTLQTTLANEKSKATALKQDVQKQQSTYKTVKAQLATFDPMLLTLREAMIQKQILVSQLNIKKNALNRELLQSNLVDMAIIYPGSSNQAVPTTTAPLLQVKQTKQYTDEQAITKAINNYRARQKLPPLKVSKSLTEVARIHVNDMNENHVNFDKQSMDGAMKACTVNSWSSNGKWTDVCYFENLTNYTAMMYKPRQLTAYKGIAVEIGYFNEDDVTPDEAVAYWLQAAGDKRIITGAGQFKDIQAMGAAINGNYAYVWFGFDKDPKGYY